MVYRKGNIFIAILLGCLMPFVCTVQLTCDNNTPALGSNLTCTCTDISLQGVVWWKGQSFLASCSSSGSCCPAQDDGYEVEVNASMPMFSMTILAYSYANCGTYYCAAFQDFLNRAGQYITISDTILDLTQEFSLSTPESNSTGNFILETPCLFIQSITVQKNIKAVWYKVLNDTEEIVSSDETIIEFEDTCRDCTGVRARKMKVIHPYKAPDTDFKGETEIVEFVLRIFEQNNESNGQNITTGKKFILAIKTFEPSAPSIGLSVGEIVGISFGVVIGLAVVFIIGFCVYKHKCKASGNGSFDWDGPTRSTNNMSTTENGSSEQNKTIEQTYRKSPILNLSSGDGGRNQYREKNINGFHQPQDLKGHQLEQRCKMSTPPNQQSNLQTYREQSEEDLQQAPRGTQIRLSQMSWSGNCKTEQKQLRRTRQVSADKILLNYSKHSIEKHESTTCNTLVTSTETTAFFQKQISQKTCTTTTITEASIIYFK